MPHTNGEPTLHELYDGMARECAVWREKAGRLRLTDEEREAIAWAARAADPDYTRHVATLRGLLERLA